MNCEDCHNSPVSASYKIIKLLSITSLTTENIKNKTQHQTDQVDLSLDSKWMIEERQKEEGDGGGLAVIDVEE